jgi:hypothetical protein
VKAVQAYSATRKSANSATGAKNSSAARRRRAGVPGARDRAPGSPQRRRGARSGVPTDGPAARRGVDSVALLRWSPTQLCLHPHNSRGTEVTERYGSVRVLVWFGANPRQNMDAGEPPAQPSRHAPHQRERRSPGVGDR